MKTACRRKDRFFLHNDPAYDAYALPLAVLKKCRKLFRLGATLTQLRARVLGDMEAMVRKNPATLTQLPIMALPPSEREAEVGIRLMKVNPHDDADVFEQLTARLRSRRYEKKNPTRNNTPRVRKSQKAWKYARYHRIKHEDPVAYAQMLAKERTRYAENMRDPEKRRARMESAERARVKRKAHLAANPDLREEHNAKRRKKYAEKKRNM